MKVARKSSRAKLLLTKEGLGRREVVRPLVSTTAPTAIIVSTSRKQPLVSGAPDFPCPTAPPRPAVVITSTSLGAVFTSAQGSLYASFATGHWLGLSYLAFSFSLFILPYLSSFSLFISPYLFVNFIYSLSFFLLFIFLCLSLFLYVKSDRNLFFSLSL